MHSITNLESLPDELLLEICKYLLCVDVLLSFDDLNIRLTRMIRDYRRHVSLHKASYAQSYRVCSTIIPKIGLQIRTLVVDNCYSALQAIAFLKYFHNRMSLCFPQLQKLILVSFRPDPLLVFLQMLDQLEHLYTIEIRSLFRVSSSQQTEVLLALFQANNQRLTSIYVDDQSSHLNPIKKYLSNQVTCPNVLHLKIELSTIYDLAVLFTLLPNVRDLSVSLNKRDHLDNLNGIFQSSERLNFLTCFQLKSLERSWCLDELIILSNKLPSLKCLSLNLRTSDCTLINGQLLKNSLGNTIEQFHYAIHYLPEQVIDCSEIYNFWKDLSPIVCLYNPVQNDYMFLHTLPYTAFDYLEISSSVAPSISKDVNSYDRIQRIHVDCDFTLAEAFPIISFCHRAKHAIIWLHGTDTKHEKNSSQVEQYLDPEKPITLSRLPRLRRLTLVGLSPKDLQHVSNILLAAPNLFRLDLPYTVLVLLLQHVHICSLLQRRITALTINNMSSSSATAREHVAQIASVFLHLRHLYIDMRSLNDKTIDLTVLCYYDEFVKQQAPLVALCVDGKPSEEMKSDAEKWLIKQRSSFQERRFAAFFNEKAGRLLIWM